jgi:hypothetical protein
MNLLHEDIFSLSRFASKSILASRKSSAGAIAGKVRQSGFRGRYGQIKGECSAPVNPMSVSRVHGPGI